MSFNDFIEDKSAAQAYASEYSHIAPNRLEFMNKVHLWEAIYIPLREKTGWVLLKGNYKDNWTGDRFKVEWQVGSEIVVATQDDWDGSVSERVKKSKN